MIFDLFRLDGQVALVTGATRGIGLGIATALAEAGAHVIMSSRVPKPEVVQALKDAGHEIDYLQADVADPEQVQKLVRDATAITGRLDILVNNAGVAVLGELDSFRLEDLDRTLDVNVRAVFVAVQAAARHMGQGGRIVNIGSTNAERMPWAGGAVYAMSKAAIVGLTRGLARDLGPRGITINNVQPGPVNTDMNPADGPMAAGMHGLMAVDRHAHPDEIAGMVAYLVGPEAGMVTGGSLLIDGGFAA